MDIIGLGHSSFLLEMTSRDDTLPVRILVDPWLGDYLIGDLLGRYPRLRIDPDTFGPIDAVWLSHSHTDHLDPESLLWLWRELSPAPALILPQSLRYLEDLFREFLTDVEILFLEQHRPVEFRGVELRAFFNPEAQVTNEDDVMVLVVSNGREVLLNEADALLPFYAPELRELLVELLLGEEIESACFVTTKNEGHATMSMLAASDTDDRKRRLSAAVETTYEEIWGIYSGLDEAEVDVWLDPRVVRFIGGQGIAYPQALGTEWNRVLFPIRIAGRVRMERETAAGNGCAHAIEALVPGARHRVEGGQFVERTDEAAVRCLDREEDRTFDPKLALFDSFPTDPLYDDERDEPAQRQQIAACLAHRFLPWLHGSRTPPFEHLLAENGGEYRIRIRFGTTAKYTDVDWRVGFERWGFRSLPPDGEPDEHYWANNITDLLDGRCDEFSIFSRRPLGGHSQRLWNYLGLPGPNGGSIERKLRLHFERARDGMTLEDWVLEFHGRSAK